MAAYEDDLLAHTPYLRRLYETNKLEGRVEGYLEGYREGIIKGKRLGDYNIILDILLWRFDLPMSMYQAIEDLLLLVADEQQRRDLIKAATQAQTLADFQSALHALTTDQSNLGNRTETK